MMGGGGEERGRGRVEGKGVSLPPTVFLNVVLDSFKFDDKLGWKIVTRQCCVSCEHL